MFAEESGRIKEIRSKIENEWKAKDSAVTPDALADTIEKIDRRVVGNLRAPGYVQIKVEGVMAEMSEQVEELRRRIL